MSRNTDASVTSASQLPQLKYRLLCEVHSVTDGPARACTGDRYIFSGNTYSPVGGLGGIEKIQEEADIFPRAVRIWFSAIDDSDLRITEDGAVRITETGDTRAIGGSSFIADVLSENLYSKPVKLYRCFLSNSYTVIGTPQLAFLGYINQVDLKLKDEERGNYFELECESRLRQPAKAIYFNRATLSKTYSGDTFFDYTPQIPLVTVNWGNQGGGTSYAGTQGSRGTIGGGNATASRGTIGGNNATTSRGRGPG